MWSAIIIRQALRQRWGCTHFWPTQSKWSWMSFCIWGGEPLSYHKQSGKRKWLAWLAGSEHATKSFHSSHQSCNNPRNAAEKRNSAPRIRPVYQKLIQSEWWDTKKDKTWKHPMIAHLKEGGRKSLVVKQEPNRWKLAIIAELISHVLQGTNGSVSWESVALVVAGGADRLQSTPANTDAKYVMRSFGIETYINKIAVNNQREKQTILQVVEKEAYLLEGNWTASYRTHECLRNCQSTRTGFSIKYHNTIRYRESLQQTQQIHNMTSVLTSFFQSSCIPDKFWWKQWVGRS